MPRLAVGAMLYKRQIYEIPLTDRSFITTADYTPFQTRCRPNLARPGRGGRAQCRTR